MTTPTAWPAVEHANWPSWTQPQLTACHSKDGSLLVQYEGQKWALYWEGNLYAGTFYPLLDSDNCAVSATEWAEEQIKIMKAHPAAGSMLWNAQHKKLVDRPGAKTLGDLDKKPEPVTVPALEVPDDPLAGTIQIGSTVRIAQAPQETDLPAAPRKKRKLFTKKDDRDDEIN